MDRFEERLTDAVRSIRALREALAVPKRAALERDAILLRFALAAETAWKAAQCFLRREGLDFASPRACVRASLQAGLLDEASAEGSLRALEDRNLIVHVYRESLAAELLERVPAHADALEHWVTSLRRKA